jgi:GH24 family phage-related lysozyme (muramidase)
MLTIQARQVTYLKKSTLAAFDIKESEKVLIDKGQKYRIVRLIGGLDSGHQKVELSDAQGIWFVFADHFTGWEIVSVIPKQAINLIKQFEGFLPYVYDDGVGVATIGFGTTIYPNGQRVKMGDPSINEAQGIVFLEHDVRAYWETISRTIPFWAEMNDNQRSALLSFAYNLGRYFYNSQGFATISTVLRDKRWDKMPQALMLYVNPGSNVEAGLRRRRTAEGKLWGS